MDEQLKNWQNAYQQSTPEVDNDALLQKIKRQDKKDHVKSLVDIAFGIAVSSFIVFVLLTNSYGAFISLVLWVLVPVPIGFSVWAYKAKKTLSVHSQLDITALLNVNKQRAIQRVRYWKVSAYVLSLLWVCLLAYLGFTLLIQQSYTIALTQVLIQVPLVLAVIFRYRFLRKALPEQLKELAQHNLE